MNAKKQTIDALIFDSGLGGLSVLSEILRVRPHLSFVYVADNAGLPYGDKSSEWLEKRVSAVIAAALRTYQPRLLVLACNTASTLVLPQIRAEVSLPVVGVVPAIKPASVLTRNKVIGLLATPATVSRSYTDRLIQDFAKDCQVIRVGSSRLVELVERKLRGHNLPLDELRSICQPFLTADPQPDTLVLGCTHFPLAQFEIQHILPHIALVDSGAAIAQRVEHLLGSELSSPPRQKKILFTSVDASLASLQAFLRSFDLEDPEELKGIPNREAE